MPLLAGLDVLSAPAAGPWPLWVAPSCTAEPVLVDALPDSGLSEVAVVVPLLSLAALPVEWGASGPVEVARMVLPVEGAVPAPRLGSAACVVVGRASGGLAGPVVVVAAGAPSGREGA